MRLPTGRQLCLCLGLGLALFAFIPPAAAQSKSRQVELRLLTQQGLAVALAVNVLFTQLGVLVSSLAATTDFCAALDQEANGGSFKVLSRKTSDRTPERVDLTIVYFFDAACRKPFVRIEMQTIRSGEAPIVFDLEGSASYRDKTGRVVGSITLKETATVGDESVLISGTGIYKPANDAPPVGLGLACRLGELGFTQPYSCTGGMAQDFPSLGAWLGSLTPLEYRPNGRLRFAGDASTLAEADEGKLGVKRSGKTALKLIGSFADRGTTATKGSTPALSLFLKRPTKWTIANAATGDVFTYEVLDGPKHEAKAVIRDRSSRAVVRVALDQSGTGAARFFDGQPIAVSTWTLGD